MSLSPCDDAGVLRNFAALSSRYPLWVWASERMRACVVDTGMAGDLGVVRVIAVVRSEKRVVAFSVLVALKRGSVSEVCSWVPVLSMRSRRACARLT